MASDYKAIREERRLDYGRKGAQVGGQVVANLYGDRTHFIFELLQNAEDALRRRGDCPKSRTVRFDLAADELRVSHYGKPFDEDDVKGICDIGEGTKSEGDIGQFGIGFKSVYRFTDRPQVHSGDEDFGIDNYVYPSAQPKIERDQDQTVFIIPLRDAEANNAVVADGLRQINLDTLLFLRQIDSVEWSLPNGEVGTYVRESTSHEDYVREVTLTRRPSDHGDPEQEWLVFSKPMHMDGKELAAHVEVAFHVAGDHIVPLVSSPLVVFFPTRVETYMGVRIQGPYVPTPSRDDILRSDPWNKTCIEKTGELLVDALLWLRDEEMLDVDVLQCLPLDEAKFRDNSMFRPLYAAVRRALRSKRLLPTLGHGYTRADSAKLGRSSELRDLVTGKRLKQLFGTSKSVSWLTEFITQDRTPELRKYLMEELDVEEVTPQSVLSRLEVSFLEHQSNAWMCRLYEFLNGQIALHRQARVAPIVRLSDGSHVAALDDVDRPQAFMPGDVKTEFPTVHGRACRSVESRGFLRAIGLSVPHPVDDVIRNILPRYDREEPISDLQYGEDIGRILAATRTNASDKRSELIERLRVTEFVRGIRTGGGEECLVSPAEVYLATERLKVLFADISGLQIIDQRCSVLGREGMSELLEECGASRHLRPVRKDDTPRSSPLTQEFLAKLREQGGHADTSGHSDLIVDWEVEALGDVLKELRRLDDEGRRIRSRYLWEELIQLEGRRGRAVFRAEYSWTHYGTYQQEFDSAFVRQLKETAWIPTANGELQRPEFVLFESLGWRNDPFMLSKIRFKPPIVDQLAEEAGFEPAMLDRLKALGITSLAELDEILPTREDVDGEPESAEGALDALGVAAPSPPSTGDLSAEDEGEHMRHVGGDEGGHRDGATAASGRGGGGHQGGGESSVGTRSVAFRSYVAVDHENDSNSDGLAHEDRMALEEAAIRLILSQEQTWRRTPRGNEGFDLVQVADGQECKWCEVKAMAGSLSERPATMSHAQFECAQEHGEAYWLYVVERAGSDEARIVRIQDPAGKAKTFTFDRGWLDVAEVD